MAWCTGLVALAAAHVPSDLPPMITVMIQWVCDHAAWVILYQIARKRSEPRLFLSPTVNSNPEWCCLRVLEMAETSSMLQHDGP
eukprot:COSAG02_NODE_203_length_29261_cov_20.960395_21_plen_84_part_00